MWTSPIRANYINDRYLNRNFLKKLEQSGLIVEAGTWVLRHACETNQRWQQQGLPALTVSVNVDAQQFQQDHFVDQVAGILTETHLDPRFLQIEVVEGTVHLTQRCPRGFAELRDQARRAALATVRHIAEGASRVSPADRRARSVASGCAIRTASGCSAFTLSTSAAVTLS